MAFIPLPHTIVVKRYPEPDKYGEVIGIPMTSTYNCRYTEKIKVVTKSSSVNNVTKVKGEEVVSSATILLDGLADIRYDDEITFVNELGTIFTNKPLNIQPIRMPDGKVAMTKVFV